MDSSDEAQVAAVKAALAQRKGDVSTKDVATKKKRSKLKPY